MKKIFYVLGLALMASLTLTSCLGDSDTENTYYAQDFFTVTGSMSSGYTLYSDHGTYVTIDKSAFNSTDGFGSTERVLLTATYTESKISADKKGLLNPDISSCYAIPTTNPMTTEVAEASNILQNDSCYSVNSLSCWAYRGYLTAMTSAGYSSVAPTMNLVYNPNNIRTDSIDVQLCYNIHATSGTNTCEYYTSFRIDALDNIVPGTRDVTMTIKCKGTQDIILTVPRQDFHKGNY